MNPQLANLLAFDLGRGPKFVGFFDHFDNLSISSTAGAAAWYLFQTGGSGAAFALDLTQTGGVLKLTQSSTDNDVLQIVHQCGIKVSDLKSGSPIYFGGRFRTPATPGDFDMFVGLFAAPSGTIDNDLVGGFVDGVGLKVAEGSASLSVLGHKDSGTDASGTLITLAASTWFRFFAEYRPVTNNTDTGVLRLEFHHNGTNNAVEIPFNDQFPDDEVLCFNALWQAGNTSAENMLWDYAYALGELAAPSVGAG